MNKNIYHHLTLFQRRSQSANLCHNFLLASIPHFNFSSKKNPSTQHNEIANSMSPVTAKTDSSFEKTKTKVESKSELPDIPSTTDKDPQSIPDEYPTLSADPIPPPKQNEMQLPLAPVTVTPLIETIPSNNSTANVDDNTPINMKQTPDISPQLLNQNDSSNPPPAISDPISNTSIDNHTTFPTTRPFINNHNPNPPNTSANNVYNEGTSDSNFLQLDVSSHPYFQSYMNRLYALDKSMRWRGLSILFWGAGIVASIAGLAFFYRGRIKTHIVQEAADAISSEQVIQGSKVTAEQLVKHMLTDEQVKKQSVDFMVGLFTDFTQRPETITATTTLLKQVLNQESSQKTLVDLLNRALASESVQQSANHMGTKLVSSESVRQAFSNSVNSLFVSEALRETALNWVKTLVQDKNLQNNTGDALWNAVLFAVTPPILKNKNGDSDKVKDSNRINNDDDAIVIDDTIVVDVAENVENLKDTNSSIPIPQTAQNILDTNDNDSDITSLTAEFYQEHPENVLRSLEEADAYPQEPSPHSNSNVLSELEPNINPASETAELEVAGAILDLIDDSTHEYPISQGRWTKFIFQPNQNSKT